MKIVLFYHSLLSDWNHGNAHFLRGVATELIKRGNEVLVYEPEGNWSLTNLLQEPAGKQAIQEFYEYYPLLQTQLYRYDTIDLAAVLADADLVIVHEWNDHTLVKAIGDLRKRMSFKLLFHDTHHRAITEKDSMQAYDLSNYDAVLAFGNVIRDIYLQEGWTRQAFTWHEAADTNLFKPMQGSSALGDLVWIGNWGDDERSQELLEFIIQPVRALQLKATIYGVRYPQVALDALADAGIVYGGWLPNFKVPEVFANYRVTAHVPRGPYVRSLPGIPTIRPFEALACGIPLVSSPWSDAEHLFRVGTDFVMENNGEAMLQSIERLLADASFANQYAEHGLDTILQKHTCVHRVDELYQVCEQIGINQSIKYHYI